MSNHKDDYNLIDTSKSLLEATYLLPIKYPVADYISYGFALGRDYIIWAL